MEHVPISHQLPIIMNPLGIPPVWKFGDMGTIRYCRHAVKFPPVNWVGNFTLDIPETLVSLVNVLFGFAQFTTGLETERRRQWLYVNMQFGFPPVRQLGWDPYAEDTNTQAVVDKLLSFPCHSV